MLRDLNAAGKPDCIPALLVFALFSWCHVYCVLVSVVGGSKITGPLAPVECPVLIENHNCLTYNGFRRKLEVR